MEISYRKLRSGTKVLTFDQLADAAKDVARSTILKDFERSYRETLDQAKLTVKGNITPLVNDKHHVPVFIRKYKNIMRLRRDKKFLDATILSNVCNFLADGTYIRYSN